MRRNLRITIFPNHCKRLYKHINIVLHHNAHTQIASMLITVLSYTSIGTTYFTWFVRHIRMLIYIQFIRLNVTILAVHHTWLLFYWPYTKLFASGLCLGLFLWYITMAPTSLMMDDIICECAHTRPSYNPGIP